ncbi:MAG: GHKL domain-containing protein [Clostridium sp.]|nr:GHKL domain-containing protein [Clostridium sp.]
MTDYVMEITSIFINTFAMLDLWLILSLLFGCDMRVTSRNLAIASGIFILVYLLSMFICKTDTAVTAVMFAYNVLVTLILTNKRRIKTMLLEIPAVFVYVEFGVFMDLLERFFGLSQYHIGAEGLTPSDMVSDPLLFVLLLCLSRTKVAKAKSIQLTIGEGVVLTLFCAFSPAIVMGLEWFEGMVNAPLYKGIWILFMMILNIAVVYAIVHRKMAAYYRQLSENYKKEFETEYSFFRDYREQQEDTVKFRHDWKNHMLLLQEMLEKGEYGKAEGYFRDLTADTSKSVYQAATGNELVDMILSTKMAVLEENGIILQCRGALSEFNFMNYVDGCILLTNLIDNAVEANEKVKGKRYILLTAKKTEGVFYLEIRNPMEGALRQAEGKILTTKAVEENIVGNIRF